MSLCTRSMLLLTHRLGFGSFADALASIIQRRSSSSVSIYENTCRLTKGLHDAVQTSGIIETRTQLLGVSTGFLGPARGLFKCLAVITMFHECGRMLQIWGRRV